MPARTLFRPGSRVRRRLIVVLSLVLATLIVLVAAALTLVPQRSHRWATGANRICERERGQVAGLRTLRLGALETLRRRTAVEAQALASFERLASRGERSRLEAEFLTWKEYELELDRWLLYGLPARDPRVPAELRKLSSAREHTRALADRLGAGSCARP